MTDYISLPTALRMIETVLSATKPDEEGEFVWLANTELHDGLASRDSVRRLWGLLASSIKSMKLQLANGTQLPCRQEWVSPPPNLDVTERPAEGMHVDLSFGLLGTGTVPWHEEERLRGELLLDKQDLRRFGEALYEETGFSASSDSSPEQPDDIREAMFGLVWSKTSDKKARGRPNSVNKIVPILSRRYSVANRPPWKAMAKELEKEEGISTSLRTLQRAWKIAFKQP